MTDSKEVYDLNYLIKNTGAKCYLILILVLFLLLDRYWRLGIESNLDMALYTLYVLGVSHVARKF